MGPNSDLILDEYIYDPGTNQGKMSVNIVSGLVKFVSGDMSSESYEIATPVGVAAVRGTEIVLFVEPMQAGVFDGGFSITRDGQTLPHSTPTANFRDEGGVVPAEGDGRELQERPGAVQRAGDLLDLRRLTKLSSSRKPF